MKVRIKSKESIRNHPFFKREYIDETILFRIRGNSYILKSHLQFQANSIIPVLSYSNHKYGTSYIVKHPLYSQGWKVSGMIVEEIIGE